MKSAKAPAGKPGRPAASNKGTAADSARERQMMAMAAIFSLERAIERGQPMAPKWGAWWLQVLSRWRAGLGQVSLEQAMGLKTPGRRGRGENALLTDARHGVHAHYVVELAGLRAMGFRVHEAIEAVRARFADDPPWKQGAPSIKPLDYEAIRKLNAHGLRHSDLLRDLGAWARHMDNEKVRAAYLAHYPRLALPPRFRPPPRGK